MNNTPVLKYRLSLKPIRRRCRGRTKRRNRLPAPRGDVGRAHRPAEELNQIQVQRRHQQIGIVGRTRHAVPKSKAQAVRAKLFFVFAPRPRDSAGKVIFGVLIGRAPSCSVYDG